jgi:hypothetical protein
LGFSRDASLEREFEGSTLKKAWRINKSCYNVIAALGDDDLALVL